MKKRSCYGIIIISFVQIFVYTMAYLAIGNFSRKEFIVIRREKMAICNLFGSRFECNKY